MTDIVERLRISRCYVRGPGDIQYDDRGEHDKHGGQPVGFVEDERREAADEIERLRAMLDRAAVTMAREADSITKHPFELHENAQRLRVFAEEISLNETTGEKP